MNLYFHSRTFYFLSDHFQICQRSFPLYFYYHLFPLSPLPLRRFSSSVSASPMHRKGTIEEILNRLIPNRKHDEVKKLKAPYKNNSSSVSQKPLWLLAWWGEWVCKQRCMLGVRLPWMTFKQTEISLSQVQMPCINIYILWWKLYIDIKYIHMACWWIMYTEVKYLYKMVWHIHVHETLQCMWPSQEIVPLRKQEGKGI